MVFAVLMEHAGSGPARVRVESKQESGYGFVDREAVRKYVEEKLEGVPSDSVPGRLLPLEQHIARSPYVERAMVYRRPSGEVRVDLWEEQPSFRLGDRYGQLLRQPQGSSDAGAGRSRGGRPLGVRAGGPGGIPESAGGDRPGGTGRFLFGSDGRHPGCPDVRRAGRRCTTLRWIPGRDCKWCWARRTSWISSSRISG